MQVASHTKRIFLTGGAGFIGSHIVDLLAPEAYEITVYDNLSNGRLAFIEKHIDRSGFRFIEGDALDLPHLTEHVAGHDLVWHLAANTDIIGSHARPDRDLRDGTIATFNVLEAMRQTGVRELLFASTGAVYGDLCHDHAVSETAGPLLPVSTYGAGKVAAEAFISSFCRVYGMRAWVFRFGNVVGGRMTHGVIFDFLNKLREQPAELLIRGDGCQEKNYFLVEECIDGMAWAHRSIEMSEDKPCDVFNLGTTTVSRVLNIAAIICDEMGLSDTKIVVEGSRLAWPGDQPRVHFSVDKINALGWRTKYTSDQSVRIAVRRMLGKVGTLESGVLV